MPGARAMLPIARELNHFGDAGGRGCGVSEPHVERVRFDRPTFTANTAIVEHYAIVGRAQRTLIAQGFRSAIGMAVVTRLSIGDGRGSDFDFDAVILRANHPPIGRCDVRIATFPNTGVPLQ